MGCELTTPLTLSVPPGLPICPSACLLRGHAVDPKNADRRGWAGWAEGKPCAGEGAREEVGPREEPHTTSSPAGDQQALVSGPAGSDGVASVCLARHLLGGAAG